MVVQKYKIAPYQGKAKEQDVIIQYAEQFNR